MIITIISKLTEISEKFKQFIKEHDTPWFFTGLFVLGLIIFMLTYKALHKHDNNI